MEEILYPTLEEAVHLHGRLLERFGGRPGVRDLGLLESALARPRSGYYRSLSEQAAALLQSLVLNHCFVDGNKRMAFALAMTFLRDRSRPRLVAPRWVAGPAGDSLEAAR